MTDLDPDLTDLSPDLSTYSSGGTSMGPTTCPSIDGVTSISVLSIKNPPSGALFAFRQGDTQPALVVQLLDGNGNAIVLTGATVTANFAIPGQTTYVQSSEMTLAEDTVTATYSRGVDDFVTVNPGRYYIVIAARWEDGTGFSAPDSSEAVCLVESSF